MTEKGQSERRPETNQAAGPPTRQSLDRVAGIHAAGGRNGAGAFGVVVGQVRAQSAGRGVSGALVTVYSVTNNVGGGPGVRRRLGSVATDSAGAFHVRYTNRPQDSQSAQQPWDLVVTVTAPQESDGEDRERVLATVTRYGAAPVETVRILIADHDLDHVRLGPVSTLPNPDDIISRERILWERSLRLDGDARDRFTKHLQDAIRLREAAQKPFSAFLDRLSSLSPEHRAARANGYLPLDADILKANLATIRAAIDSEVSNARPSARALVAEEDLEDWKGRFGPELEAIPSEAVEAKIWPWKATKPNRLIQSIPLRDLCQGPPDNDCVALLEGGSIGTNSNGQPTALGGPATPGQASPQTGAAGATGGSDIPSLVHRQVDPATPPEITLAVSARPGVVDVQTNVDSFLIKSGPADAPALFDFNRLHIAFEPLWHELFDSKAKEIAQQLYEGLVDLGVDPNAYLFGPGDTLNLVPAQTATKKAAEKTKAPNLLAVIRAFDISDAEWDTLTTDQQTKLAELASIVNGEAEPTSVQLTDANQAEQQFAAEVNANPPSDDQGIAQVNAVASALNDSYKSAYSAAQQSALRQGEKMIHYAETRVDSHDNKFDQFHQLLADLDKSLKEPYRFNVYAANGFARSINFGIVVNYRQRWEPVTYQVGELVKTIPLAPKETRRFSKKLVARKSRSEKEVENNIESRRTESSEVSRAETEIVQKAINKTNFQLSAEGGVSIAIAHVDAKTGLSLDAEHDSQETKKAFREAVFKATEEYKAERTLQVESTDSADSTTEESGEIVNPNDEISVTYLFYQLQRRFRVSEEIRSVTPVVLVAQEFPNPGDIDEDWIVKHDWILRRVLLDDSFLPALNYLSTKVVGDEVALRELHKHVEQQRRLVESLKDQLVTLGGQVTGRYTALEQSIAQRAAAVAGQDSDSGFMGPGLAGEGLFKSASDFLFGGNDNSPEAAQIREDAARDAYERAEKQKKEMQERLDRETTALATAIENYTKQLSEHLNRKAQIARLRVHIKANIFYYMQAIWSHEPPDQRYFRLHDVQVPRLKGTKTYKVIQDPNAVPLPPTWQKPYKIILHSQIDKDSIQHDALGDIADLDTPLGFKGNYMILPLLQNNDLTDLLMLPYYGDPLVDPDPLGNWTLHDLVEYACCVRKNLSEAEFDKKLPGLIEAYRLLKEHGANDGELIVPTDSLYIEALPGVHPILEDFKLLHRAIDVKKVQAEVRGAELENIRFAARLLAGERGDPTVEKTILVENPGTTIVAPNP